MKKIAMKLIALSVFALCMTLNLNAQDIQRAERPVKTEQEKLEKRTNRLNKMADRLEMTATQRERFIPAQLDFMAEAKAIKKSGLEKEERKAQMNALATDHKNYLSSFLSADQMTKIERRLMKRKGKRGGKKKGKRSKRAIAQ